jgi:biofilm protein TabA
MIIGSLDQPDLRDFLSKHPAFQQAFDWLLTTGSTAPDGITEIGGEDFYANGHGYTTKDRAACEWESHRHTADIQVCLKGGELIDWSPVKLPASSGRYERDRDFERWPSDLEEYDTIRLEPRRFAIFLPNELHRPVITNGRDASIRKVVIKIDARFL